jgi:hypothetical protein
MNYFTEPLYQEPNIFFSSSCMIITQVIDLLSTLKPDKKV